MTRFIADLNEGAEKMTRIYEVVAKRHRKWDGREFVEDTRNVILLYDEDKETSIEFMQKYSKQNGFTLEEKGGKISIADLILRERESTGKEIARWPWIDIFDIYGKRRYVGG